MVSAHTQLPPEIFQSTRKHRQTDRESERQREIERLYSKWFVCGGRPINLNFRSKLFRILHPPPSPVCLSSSSFRTDITLHITINRVIHRRERHCDSMGVCIGRTSPHPQTTRLIVIIIVRRLVRGRWGGDGASVRVHLHLVSSSL